MINLLRLIKAEKTFKEINFSNLNLERNLLIKL